MSADRRSRATQPLTPSTIDVPLDREGPAATPSGVPITPIRVCDPERYAILGEHGRGALGCVSRAHDKALGRDVAIKELLSRDHVSEVRFLREALITARLEHPGIVAVHEAGWWPNGTPFYAMRLVSGRPLRELIAERASLSERISLLHHVIAVADAIAYAHGRNVIHRDLKPANIIVGECGETVVIDWGLAKDLTALDAPAGGSGQIRIASDSEITSAGTVLGTPAYMAPEQERGESVDQRADVFAIGAMLWELCTSSRVPPPQPRERRRKLRLVGIDDDLAIIIDKAVDSDPARRYPDAGALANDLKSFKSGARIAARRYSLPAMLGHWVRRHRAIAYSALGTSLVVASLVVLFIRNTVVERDRAEAANNERLLGQAELHLHTDPTAAVVALSEYRGNDTVRRRRLIAEAEGRGVARAVLTPHSDTVWFVAGDRTGAIVSVGEDRRIQLTRGARSTTLAADVSTAMRLAYAPSRRLLAYATAPTGVSILDLQTTTTRRISTISPSAIVFSADGSRLAALDGRGELYIWSTAPDAKPLSRITVPGATTVKFMTPAHVIVLARSALRAIALDTGEDASGIADVLEVTTFDARPDAVVAGTADGRIVMLTPSLTQLSTTTVCRKAVRQLRFIPQSDRLAFSCKDPVAGIAGYDTAQHRLTIIETFATRGLTRIAPDFSGRYVAVADESNTAYVYDTLTRLMSHYDGNAGQPNFVSAPTPEFDHVLIGDVNGTVRVWDHPTSAARVVLTSSAAFFGLAFVPDGTALYIGGADGTIRRIAASDDAVTELRGHTAMVSAVRASPDGRTVLSYGHDGTVRIWRTSDATSSRVLADHASIVEDAEYIDGGRRVLSVGDDGRLLAWSPEGSDVSVLFKHTAPLTGVEALESNHHAVTNDAAGSVWDVSPLGETRKVREGDGVAITVLRVSASGRYLAVGTATGVVTVYKTSNWQVIKTIDSAGSIRQIQFDPMDRDLIFISEAGRTQHGHVQIVALGTQRTLRWQEVTAAARDVAYSPDGDAVGFVCADGGTWLYSIQRDSWVYTRDHNTDTFSARFSPDGKLYASVDRSGVVVVRNVNQPP